MTGSNLDVNKKNSCGVGGRITHSGTMGGLIDKLLANPHMHILQADIEHQRYNLGEQWWDLQSKSNLAAPPPRWGGR